jgi:hypothetical protein
MTDERLAPLEELYIALSEDDPLGRALPLFAFAPLLLRPIPAMGFDEREAAVNEEQTAALRNVAAVGVEAVLELIDQVERPSDVGWVAAQLLAESPDLEPAIMDGLKAAEGAPREQAVRGFCAYRFRADGWEWATNVLESVEFEGPADRASFLLALPRDAATWDRVAASGAETSETYWRRFVPGGLDDPQVTTTAAQELLHAGRPVAAADQLNLYLEQLQDGVSPELVATILEAVLSAPEAPPGNLTAYALERLLKYLQSADGIAPERLAAIEWGFLPMFRFGSGSPETLHAELGRSPEFFVELVSIVYRREGEDPSADAEPDNQAQRRAELAYELLDTWRIPPGVREGVLEAVPLLEWIEIARRLLHESGRSRIGDLLIGKILRHTPNDPDGTWPAEPIKVLIDELRSDALESGLETEISNRGVSWRAASAGGETERQLAQQYDRFAAAAEDRWPRTAAFLRRVARNFRLDAQHHDERTVGWEELSE